jgi:hypothetical protein
MSLEFDLLPGRVVARVFAHEFQTAAGVVACWSYVTAGLRAFGQREIVFTLKRPEGAPLEHASRDPLAFLQAIAPLAERGQIVHPGDYSAMGPHGLLPGCPELRGVAYATAWPIDGVPLPTGCLSAIPLVAHEMETARRFGTLRVLARIGHAYRFFPTAPWCDPRRAPLMPPETETLLAGIAGGRFAGTSAVLDGERIVLRLARAAVPRLAQSLADMPPNKVLALFASLDVSADSCLVWSPGQRAPQAISALGGRGHRISGCFLALVPQQGADGGRVFEDGFVMMLTDASCAKLVGAMKAGAPLALPATEAGGKSLSLEWIDEDEADVRDSQDAPVETPGVPPGAVASTLRIQHIVLYQPDRDVGARLPGGVESLASYTKALQHCLGHWYAAHDIGPRTARALIAAITPRGHGYWLLAPTGPAPETAEVRAILEAVPRPSVVGGPVAIAVVCNLGDNFPSAGGPAPMPPEWAQIDRDSAQPLPLDEILMRLLG